MLPIHNPTISDGKVVAYRVILVYPSGQTQVVESQDWEPYAFDIYTHNPERYTQVCCSLGQDYHERKHSSKEYYVRKYQGRKAKQ